jgi:hypothetical protein
MNDELKSRKSGMEEWRMKGLRKDEMSGAEVRAGEHFSSYWVACKSNISNNKTYQIIERTNFSTELLVVLVKSLVRAMFIDRI